MNEINITGISIRFTVSRLNYFIKLTHSRLLNCPHRYIIVTSAVNFM